MDRFCPAVRVPRDSLFFGAVVLLLALPTNLLRNFLGRPHCYPMAIVSRKAGQ